MMAFTGTAKSVFALFGGYVQGASRRNDLWLVQPACVPAGGFISNGSCVTCPCGSVNSSAVNLGPFTTCPCGPGLTTGDAQSCLGALSPPCFPNHSFVTVSQCVLLAFSTAC